MNSEHDQKKECVKIPALNQRRAKHQHQHYDPPKREDEENPNTTSHYSWQASQSSDNTS